jgi:hypothetical protein
MTSTAPETDFHVVGFFVADHAAVESGKVYVNGGFWDRLNLPSYPAVTSFSVVVVLQVPWRAHNQTHKFGVRFEGSDAKLMPSRFEGEFQVGPPADQRAGDSSLLPVALPINSFLLERPGDYAAALELDGTEIARWRFRAVQTIVAGTASAALPSSSDPPPLPTDEDDD